MASQFNQFDWYWSVQDNNPSGLVYGTKPAAYVTLADADYVAWLAKDGGGNQPTVIDTDASLRIVLNNFAISNYFPSTKYLTMTADVTLTNPPPNLISVTNNTGALLKVIMPIACAPNSIPIGIPIVFKNVSVGAGAFAVALMTSNGTTSVGGPPVEPGMIITAVPAGNNNKLGGWDVRNSGNVSGSGIPVAGQYAKWTSQFTITSVPPNTVLNDIQAYPVTGGTLTGNVTIAKSQPRLIFNKQAAGETNQFSGWTANVVRWTVNLGDSTAESGSNAGSDFSIQRFTDAGGAIDYPLTINRSSGLITLLGNVNLTKTSPILTLDKASNGQQSRLEGKTAGSLRWTVLLGEETNESGSNAGSSFRIDAYSDAGAYRSSPLTIGRNTGAVVLSNDLTVTGNLSVLGTTIGKREVLTAARSYFVNDSTGLDTNTGLTAGVPFKTIQKAVDVACGLDTNIYNVTINVADGTYSVTGTAVTLKTITGAGAINLVGNSTTPTNCVIAATSGFCIYAPGVRGVWNIGGFHLKALTAGFDNILATQMSLLNLTGLRFEGLNAHVHATFGAVVIVNNGNGMSIAGNFNIHLFCDSHSTIQEVGCTYTAVGTPAIGQAWAWCTQGALIITNANTYTACVCTGPRYFVSGVSYVNTGTAGNATYFPGSTAGSVATGGIYD